MLLPGKSSKQGPLTESRTDHTPTIAPEELVGGNVHITFL